MTKKRLSDQFREQLDSLGKSLAAHTRSLDSHFKNQVNFLSLREEEVNNSKKQLEAENTPKDDLIYKILSPFLEGDLNFLTVVELKRLCSQSGLKKYSSLRRKELIEFLKINEIKAPMLPPDKLVKKMKRADLEKIVQIFLEY